MQVYLSLLQIGRASTGALYTGLPDPPPGFRSSRQQNPTLPSSGRRKREGGGGGEFTCKFTSALPSKVQQSVRGHLGRNLTPADQGGCSLHAS